jgi:hypothetical protein
MSEKKVTLIFKFRGSYLLTFVDRSKDEGARAFPPFSHSPHLKIEKKVKPIIAHPKARIEDEAKKKR